MRESAGLTQVQLVERSMSTWLVGRVGSCWSTNALPRGYWFVAASAGVEIVKVHRSTRLPACIVSRQMPCHPGAFAVGTGGSCTLAASLAISSGGHLLREMFLGKGHHLVVAR